MVLIKAYKDTKLFLDEGGRLYLKQYDQYGGVGSRTVPRILQNKETRELISKAPKEYR